jgi:cytochrome P450
VLQAVSRPPGPRGSSLAELGVLLGDLLAGWRGLHRKYGPTVHASFGPFELWSFADPEAIHEVLVTEHKIMRKGWGYNGLRRLLGEGLITTDAAHWGTQRQALNPLFSPAATEDYSGAIHDAVKAGVDEIEAGVRAGETIDIGAAMLRLTMRVISRAAFGVDLGEGHDDVGWAFSYAFGHLTMSMARPFQPPLWMPTRANAEYRRASRIIEGFISGLIDEARAHPDASTMNGKIMKALEGNPREMLRDEVISLYFAGFETTARTMTFLLYELGRNPDYIAQLRAESAGFGRPDGAVSVLRQLPLACEIVNETLRLYPPVAMLARQPRADTEIAGYPVKKNALIILLPLIGQRDTRYWPAGDSFAPDPANPLPRRLTHKGAFVPFGGGPRVCLGKHFALVEMAVATSMLAQRFDWTLDDARAPELEFNGTIHPKTPIRASFSLAGSR